MQGIISNFHCTLHLSVHIINVPGIGKNILFPHLYPIFFFFFSFTVTLCVVTFPNFLYSIQPTIYLKFKILYSCYFSWSKCQVNETGFRFFFFNSHGNRKYLCTEVEEKYRIAHRALLYPQRSSAYRAFQIYKSVSPYCSHCSLTSNRSSKWKSYYQSIISINSSLQEILAPFSGVLYYHLL